MAKYQTRSPTERKK